MDRINEDLDSCKDLTFNPEINQINDSGFGLDTTPDDDPPFLLSSPSLLQAPKSPSSMRRSSISRSQLLRNSLRKLKRRSAEFLRSEMRPSCLKPSSTDIALQSQDEVDGVAIGGGEVLQEKNRRRKGRGNLTRQDAAKRSSYESMTMSNPQCHSIKSSNSEITLSSEPPGIIWMKEGNNSRPITPPMPARLHSPQVMSTYRRVLSCCLLNPLGNLDKSGFNKSDLISYLQEVFDIDKVTHELLILELENSEPPNVVLNVTVFEAKDLRSAVTPECTNPVCLLGVDAHQSPLATPITSPTTTPSQKRKHRLSQEFHSDRDLRRNESTKSCTLPRIEKSEARRTTIKRRLRNNSLDMDILLQTETIKSTVNPAWNEKFQLNVTDVNTEALNIYIWNHLDANDRLSQRENSRSSIKSFFNHIRSTLDGCRNFANCLGQTQILLKDIPLGGVERWYPIYCRDKRLKTCQTGQCRMHMQLSVKSTNAADINGIQDFHSLLKNIYTYELGKLDVVDHFDRVGLLDEQQELSQLSSQQTIRCVLDQFAAQRNLNTISHQILELAVLIDVRINDQLIKQKLSNLHEVCSRLDVKTYFREHPLTAYERNVFGESVSTYVRRVIREVTISKRCSKLFPPNEAYMEELISSTSTAVSLLTLPADLNSSIPQDLQLFFHQCLQDDVRQWLIERCESLQSTNKDLILEKTRMFITTLEDAKTAITPNTKISQYFNRIGVDYYKVVSLTIEARLSTKAKELTFEMDAYQIKYHRFDVNVKESSNISLQHYFALRALFLAIRNNVSDRDLFRVSMTNYQNWFKGSVTFWLQTFREQCLKRMEKALRLETDVVEVTSLVKHSNSPVFVLSSFATMILEWQQIDFNDADIALLGVTKITDTICDCVKAYMDKVIEIMEHNGYYDYIDNQQFDVTDQLCISLNNISHLRQYLSQLSTLLNWKTVTDQLSLNHGSDDTGMKAFDMLGHLVETTDEEMKAEGRILAKQIIEKMAVDLKKNTILFTRYPVGKAAEVDPLLNYLENNMKVLFKKLEADLFPLFWDEIWKSEIRIFCETLTNGKPPRYYQDMLEYLEILRQFFEEDVELCRNKTCKMYCSFLKILETNAMPSEKLMLQYYKSLTEITMTPSEYYGQLTVKVGYRPEGEKLVRIYACVVQANELPGMSNKDLSSPFITVSLCPVTIFPSAVKHQTKVEHGTVCPVYDENFIFPIISDKHLKIDGAVIIFSIWHYVPLFSNDFLGEIVLPLSGLRELSKHQTVENLPAIMMPLRRPKEPRTGSYKVLKERLSFDEEANILLNQRNRDVVFRTRCNFCKPVKCIVSTITGKKMEVIGKQASISTE